MPWADSSYKNLRRAATEELIVEVGIVEQQTHRNPNGGKPADMATIYAAQDLGTANIPKRETLMPALKNLKLHRMGSNVFENAARGKPKAGLKRVGNAASEAVKDQIKKITKPSLSQRTIEARRRRGNSSSKPLIDTRQMINAISSKVL